MSMLLPDSWSIYLSTFTTTINSITMEPVAATSYEQRGTTTDDGSYAMAFTHNGGHFEISLSYGSNLSFTGSLPNGNGHTFSRILGSM